MAEAAPMPAVLVVEPVDALRHAIVGQFSRAGCDARGTGSAAEARALLHDEAYDVVLVESHLPDGEGVELVQWIVGHGRAGHVFCMMAEVRLRAAVEAMRAGCADVLEKPIEVARVLATVMPPRADEDRDMPAWRREIAPDVIGDDPRLVSVLRTLRRIAPTECSVLVNGESGTGKELVARAIHRASNRARGPFVALNCAAIPENLVEAELFGHMRGAFTGAVSDRQGAVASAHGGTLFLDEIGDMPLSAQAKLLRVLQERAVRPVGSDQSVSVDIRIVAATNQDLEALIDEGRFRADLYYRLGVIKLALPALRERKSDIPALARFFVREANHRHRTAVTGLDAAAEAALRGWTWPGNVRELANAIERATVLKGEGLLTAGDLGLPSRGRIRMAAATTVFTGGGGDVQLNLKQAINDVERRLIREALDRAGGNRAEAAALLGLNRTTLIEKLRKHAG